MTQNTPLLALPEVFCIALIATAFGCLLLKAFGLKLRDAVESSLLGFGLGIGTIAYLVLALGLLGLLYPHAVLALVGVLALVSFREIKALVCSLASGISRGAKSRSGTAASLVTVAGVVLASTVLISALAPPSALDWDGLAYHLAVPRMYASEHRIAYVPFISHSNFAFLTEMLYTLGLCLGSVVLAKLFHFLMYIGVAVGIISLCRRYATPAAGGIAALLFMSVPLAVWEGGVAYADLTTALYVLLLVYCTLNWERASGYSWLVLAGIFGGLAFGTKFLGSVPVLAVCLWILISAWRTRGLRSGIGSSVLVGGLALLIGSPWYIKSFICTGNPVYPFLYNVFGGRNWSMEAAHMYRAEQLKMGMGRSPAEFLMLPWNTAMNGSRFFDSKLVYGLVGPAFVGLLGLTALLKQVDRLILKLLFVSLVFVSCWFFLMQNSRYLLTILPLVSIAAGMVVYQACSEWRIARLVVVGFTAIPILMGILLGLLTSCNAGRVAVGAESADTYLSRTLGDIYEAEMYINRSAPPTAKVILYDEVRGFYLDRQYIWGNPGHHELIPYRRLASGGMLVDWLRARGYTHALINWSFTPKASAGHYQDLIAEAIGTGRMLETYSSRMVSVYELADQ